MTLSKSVQQQASRFKMARTTANVVNNGTSPASKASGKLISTIALLPTPLLPESGAAHAGLMPITPAASANAPPKMASPTGPGNGAQSSRLVRYKTEMCRNYKERGSCIYGEQCQFAHGHREMREVTRNTKYKTKRCMKYWSDGYCVYGPRCNFLHADNLAVSPKPAEAVNFNFDNAFVKSNKAMAAAAAPPNIGAAASLTLSLTTDAATAAAAAADSAAKAWPTLTPIAEDLIMASPHNNRMFDFTWAPLNAGSL